MNDECVESIMIDVCARTFLLESDEGTKKRVVCNTAEEFMNVMKLVTKTADPEIITYADLTLHGKTK